MFCSDGWQPYVGAVEEAFGRSLNFAQLIKIYAMPPDADHRYSPPECVEAVPVERSGWPVPERICTSIIERSNGTTRQFCKRLARLTYSFSKKWVNLRWALALHFATYNFVRRHGSIGTSPAVAAGLTDHRWTMEELLGVR